MLKGQSFAQTNRKSTKSKDWHEHILLGQVLDLACLYAQTDRRTQKEVDKNRDLELYAPHTRVHWYKSWGVSWNCYEYSKLNTNKYEEELFQNIQTRSVFDARRLLFRDRKQKQANMRNSIYQYIIQSSSKSLIFRWLHTEYESGSWTLTKVNILLPTAQDSIDIV